MNLIINGDAVTCPEGTLLDVIEHLGLQAPWTLVEHNGEPVHRDTLANITPQNGDILEIVRAVAGG